MRWPLLCALLALAACSLPRWPVDGRMTSPFGVRIDGWLPEIHRGVDIAAPEGTAVRAMAAGRVRSAGTLGGYGRTVIVDHGDGVVTLYAHLSAIVVVRGERVRHRQVIGRVGRTGNARGAHLHFEVRLRERPADPVPLLGRPPG